MMKIKSSVNISTTTIKVLRLGLERDGRKVLILKSFKIWITSLFQHT